MDSLFFSIIVPVHNPPREYFDVCIRSLLAQTIQDFEIILVDDGSEITCHQLCDMYAAMDSRIRVIHQENQGVSAARNLGIKMATAKWIMFVDADDWLEPCACERLKTSLNTRECDILMFNAVNEYENKTEIIHNDFDSAKEYNTAEVLTREMLYRKAMRPKGQRNDPVYFCWDKVYKRIFLTENNINFSVGLPKSEDKVFVLSCFEKLKIFYYMDDVLYHYRIHESSTCNKYSENADSDRVKLAVILHDIALRMDNELAELTGEADYKKIVNDYYRFIFGIISDVLLLKFYHPQCPYSKRESSKAAKAFVKSEHFKTAIQKCKYKELSSEAKLKKLLLSIGLVDEFIYIKKFSERIKGKKVSS